MGHTQVLLLAGDFERFCALLPIAARASITVKRSFQQKGSRDIWWYTIMAPVEVMQQIEDTWHILEAKTSWSLRPSLSGCPNSQVAALHCPLISPRFCHWCCPNSTLNLRGWGLSYFHPPRLLNYQCRRNI